MITVNADSHIIQDDKQLAKAVINSQIKTLTDDMAQTELAAKYKLIGERTNLILVHERDIDKKSSGMPVLHKIPQMAVEDIPMESVRLRLRSAPFVDTFFYQEEKHDLMPMFSRRKRQKHIAWEDIINALNHVDWHDKTALLAIINQLPTNAIQLLKNNGVDPHIDPFTALILLAAWMIHPASSIASHSLIRHVSGALDKMPESLINDVRDALDKHFPGYSGSLRGN